jgi:hypothetical protein
MICRCTKHQTGLRKYWNGVGFAAMIQIENAPAFQEIQVLSSKQRLQC